MPIEITAANFEEVVVKSDKPVVVDFWATWCGPCKMMSPVVDELAEELGAAAVVGKINVDEQQELAARFGVMSRAASSRLGSMFLSSPLRIR